MPRRPRTDILSPEIDPAATIAQIAGAEAPAEVPATPIPIPAPPTASPKLPSGKLGELYGKIADPDGRKAYRLDVRED